MATDKHNLFDATDWHLWRDYLHDYPQWIADLDALGDEMHEYERAVHNLRRGYNIKVPERPNLSLRLAQITNQAFEFARVAPGQRTLFEQPKPRTAKGQLLLADSGVSDQPVNRPKPEAAMPPEVTAPKQVAPLAGQKSMFGDELESPKHSWQMTYNEVRDAVTPSTRAELHAARPHLAALYPEQLTGDRATMDQWGIHRAVNRGDEFPRTPTVELSKRHKAVIAQAAKRGEKIPPHVIAEYENFDPMTHTELPSWWPQEGGDGLEPVHHAVGKRFGIPPEAVRDAMSTHPDVLAKRDKYFPPSSSRDEAVGPTLDYEKLPISSARIDYSRHTTGDTANAPIDYLREFDPHSLKLSEHEDGMSNSGSVRSYADWAKAGHVPPPVSVFDSSNGNGDLVSTNRRRVLAARMAGKKLIGWHGRNNDETGLPLKYGDILKAAKEFHGQQFSRDPGPVEFSAPAEEVPPHRMSLAEFTERHAGPEGWAYPSQAKDVWRTRIGHAQMRGMEIPSHIQQEYDDTTPEHLRPKPPKVYPDPKAHPAAFSVVPDDDKIESHDDDDGFYYHVLPRKHVRSVLKNGISPTPPAQTMGDGWYKQYSQGKAFVTDRAGVPFWHGIISNHLESQGKKPNLAVVRIPKHHVGPLESDEPGTRDARQSAYYSTGVISPKKPVGPVEFSAWREEDHIRETTQHDGKEPGEFAPKENGGNGHEIDQEDAARTERAVANAATKPPENFAPVNSPLPKPYLFHDQPLSEITGDIPSRPSWLRKRDAKPLGEWTEAHDFADAATAKYDIQGRQHGRGYLVPGIDEVVNLMPVAHAQIMDELITREAAKKAARQYTGMNARHEYADRDWSSIPRFDETSREIAGIHPEIGIRPDDHYAPQKMWDFVREGKYTLPKLHSQDVADVAAAMIASARKAAFERPIVFAPEPSEDDPEDEWTVVHHGDADDSDADLVHSGFDPSQFSRTSEIDAIADRMGVDADSLRAALSAMPGSEEDSLIWLRKLARDPSRGVIRDRDGRVIGFLTRNGKQIQLRDASGKMSGTVTHSSGRSTFRDRRGHMGGSVGEFSRVDGPVEFARIKPAKGQMSLFDEPQEAVAVAPAPLPPVVAPVATPKVKQPKAPKVKPVKPEFTDGGVVDWPQNNTWGPMTGIRVRHGSDGHTRFIHPTDSSYTMAKVATPHVMRFLDEIRGKLDHEPNSGHSTLDRVLSGQGKFIGKGHEGMAFDAGNGMVVKASVLTPFHIGQGMRTPEEANKIVDDSVAMTKDLRRRGIPGILPQYGVNHEGRSFAVQKKVDTAAPLQEHHIKQLEKTIEGMHNAGYLLRDEVQAGLDHNGNAAIYDVGSATRTGQQKPEWDREDMRGDFDRLSRLAAKHGIKYTKPFDRDQVSHYVELLEKAHDEGMTPGNAIMLRTKLKGIRPKVLERDPSMHEWTTDMHNDAMDKLHSIIKPTVQMSRNSIPIFGTVLPPDEAKELAGQIRDGDEASKNGGRPTVRIDTGPMVVSRIPTNYFDSVPDEDYGNHTNFIRSTTNPDRVARYKASSGLPPINVSHGRGKYPHVSDGGHRLMAAIDRGDQWIDALVPPKVHEQIHGKPQEFARKPGSGQQSFDWDETEHPRDSDGKFAAKLHHTIKQYLSDGTRRYLRDIHGHTGDTKVDALDPTANETTAALKHLRDSGQINSSEPAYGEPQFYMTDDQLKKHRESASPPKEAIPNVADVKEAKKMGAGRTRSAVRFDPPITGPSGESLTSYEWKYEWIVDDEKSDDPIRVSDWNEAEFNEHTKRNVVHSFTVTSASGEHQHVSLETAVKLLGLVKKSEDLNKVRSLANAAIKLAQAKQEHQELLEMPAAKVTSRHQYDVKASAERIADLEQKVEFLNHEAAMMSSGKSPVDHYREVAHKLHLLKELHGIEVSHKGKSEEDRLAYLKADRERLRALQIAGAMNSLGEIGNKTPVPNDKVKHRGHDLPVTNDAKMRNWYLAHGEDAENAIKDSQEWLKKNHPKYAKFIRHEDRKILNDNPSNSISRDAYEVSEMLEKRQADNPHAAWLNYRKTGRVEPHSFTAKSGDGHYVIIDGTDKKELDHYKAAGFESTGPASLSPADTKDEGTIRRLSVNWKNAPVEVLRQYRGLLRGVPDSAYGEPGPVELSRFSTVQ